VQVATVGGRKARHRLGGFPTRRRPSPPATPSSTARPTRPRQRHGRSLGGCATGWPRPSRTCARRPRTATATTSTATSSPASPHHPRRPHRQAPAGLLQPAITPAHKERHADRRVHHRPRPGDTAVGAERGRPRRPHRQQPARPGPARQAHLDKPIRPHPVIWTDERVEAWRRDGIRPPVAVWTLRQLVSFLTGVENDRLAALWWLIALRGLRRGEAAALDRDDLDSESRELTITRQLIALPGELYCGPPKSRASTRTIALDEAGARRLVDQALRQTVELLRHQFTDQRRSDSRTRTGPGWRQGRPMFTYADGWPIRPEYLTHRFRTLIKELDLPPIRLHDLRHGAATLALASHTDLKVIQQMLGHSSIVTTADTYTSVLPEAAHRAAQATADMIIQAARSVPGSGHDGTAMTHIPAAVAASGYCQT
jgi:integrase